MKISYKYFRCCLSPCKIANKSKEKEKFKEKIYIYIYALCRACLLDCVLRSKPEGSSRSRVHRMTRWNEVAFDSSLLGRGDCAIAVPHATELDTVVARFAGVESTFKNISTFKEKWMGSGEKYILRKSLEKYFFTHNWRHLCEFLHEFLHVSFTLQIRLGEVVSARHVRPDAKVVSAD